MECLPPFPSFDWYTDKANAGPRWNKWVERLELLFTGLNIDNDDRKRALLLHYAGEKVYDIYQAEKGNDAATYEATKTCLKSYFEPKKNVQMEIYRFRTCVQKEGQSLDEYVTELRTLAKDCEFGAARIDKEILSQVIQHCRSNRLRRRALREPDKSLRDILEMGRSLETADMQATAMEHDCVNRIGGSHRQQPRTGKHVGRNNFGERPPPNPHFRIGLINQIIRLTVVGLTDDLQVRCLISQDHHKNSVTVMCACFVVGNIRIPVNALLRANNVITVKR